MENVFNILEERGYIEQMTHPKEIKELFGNSVDCDKSKPTNGEFIVTLADRLKLEDRYV